MMGRQHCLSGVLAGVGLVALMPPAPLPVKALTVAVTGGAALLPDLDEPNSTPSRSLGLLTRLLAHGIAAASLTLYHATRSPGDPHDRKSGHRLATHVPSVILLGGALLGLLGGLLPVSWILIGGLLCGLLGLGLRAAGFPLALIGGGLTWWVTEHHQAWSWWVLPVSVTVGCLVHTMGDFPTNSGVPLLWPLVSQGKRWRLVHAPVTFSAGDEVETRLVAPLLVLCLVASAAQVTGVLPVVIAAVSKGVS